jgi:hypothetical protein
MFSGSRSAHSSAKRGRGVGGVDVEQLDPADSIAADQQDGDGEVLECLPFQRGSERAVHPHAAVAVDEQAEGFALHGQLGLHAQRATSSSPVSAPMPSTR